MGEDIFIVDSADLRRAGGGSTIRLIPVSQAGGVPGSTVGAGAPAIGQVTLSVNNTRGLNVPLYPDRYFRVILEEVSEEEALASLPKQAPAAGTSSVLTPGQ